MRWAKSLNAAFMPSLVGALTSTDDDISCRDGGFKPLLFDQFKFVTLTDRATAPTKSTLSLMICAYRGAVGDAYRENLVMMVAN